MTKEELAASIDHTLLAATATPAEIRALCAEAKEHRFASVCVNPVYVPLAADELAGSAVKVCTVIGFPLGAATAEDKAAETRRAIMNGADEADMVIALGAATTGDFAAVEADIAQVVECARDCGMATAKKITVKCILETCYLDDETIARCCECAVRAGADFVKTSTGFAAPKDSAGNALPNGAQARHVALMRKTVGEKLGVKASGGIRTAAAAREMIAAGANRIGTSSGVAILADWE